MKPYPCSSIENIGSNFCLTSLAIIMYNILTEDSALRDKYIDLWATNEKTH